MAFARVTWARRIASGFGLGHAPAAPGTVGSAAALAIGVGLLHWRPASLPVAAVLAGAIGAWAVSASRTGDDPGWVVIDEVAGQWIAMLPLAWRPPPWNIGGWVELACAFALFRLFDIAKPGPVGWMDRRHGAIAVMGDDVIAGALAAGVLLAGRRLVQG